jgi:hypothetical protein
MFVDDVAPTNVTVLYASVTHHRRTYGASPVAADQGHVALMFVSSPMNIGLIGVGSPTNMNR